MSLPGPSARSVRPTMTQVAAVCGVSTGAVSLALNRSLEESRLREETYGRIRRVAAEMGYRADWRGRALAKGRIHSVGLLSARITPHVTDVYEQMFDVVAETLAARGYHLHFIPAVGDGERWREIVEDQRVEGCLIIPPMRAGLPSMLRTLGMPAVLINEQTDEAVPQFLPDDEGGTRLAMQHLYDLGHRRIGFAMSPGNYVHHSAIVRSETFAAFAREHGIADGCRRLVMEADQLVADLRAGNAGGVTAVLCYKASYAIGLMHAAWRAGMVVPRDVSIATFDDSWILSQLNPPLTAVGIPMNEIASRASGLLIDMIESNDATQTPPKTGVVMLAETLVVRESTAAV